MIGGIGGFGSIRIINPYANNLGVAPAAQPAAVDNNVLSQTFKDVVSLRESLEELAEALDVRKAAGNSALPAAVSTAILGLNITASPAQNELVAPEINATPTSFSPFGPDIQGGSTSLVTVTGIYTGTTDDTLTFDIRRDETIGSNGKEIKVDVLDGNGDQIDQIVIAKNEPPDTVHTLDNGLRVSFSAGDVEKNDTFTVDVFATVGSVVDPDKPFNGTRNDRPNFEYGKSVTAGSFDLNGTTIDVFDNDTINTVLARINASGAGVLAQFDALNESILITQESEGPLAFTLENDTSGFLSATKLGGASDLVFTTLTSTEVNPVTTSYGLFGPDFAGASTSLPTVAGTYNGTTDETLTVKIKKDATIGSNNKAVGVDILDANGDKIDSFNIPKNAPPDTPFLLDNGLTIAFSAGDIVKDDTFTIDVSASVGSVVDPDKPFDGLRNDRPNFVSGKSVTAGSFAVNGVTIDVFADDTINTVVDRINSAGAGVEATFFAGSELFQLRQTTPGPVDITVDSDTSGFLDAVGLLGQTPELGNYIPSDPDREMSGVSQFSGITNGNFLINGVSISVDIDNDTLVDIIDRINASGAGVTANLEASLAQVSFTSNDAVSPMVLADGDTSFFTTLGITPGAYAPIIENQGGRVQTHDAVEALKKVADSLNDLYRPDTAALEVLAIRNELQGILGEAFEKGGPRYSTDFGVEFDFRSRAKRIFTFSGQDQEQFKTSFRRHTESVRDFFLEPGSGSDAGLIEHLIARLDAAESQIKEQLGSIGLFVSVTA